MRWRNDWRGCSCNSLLLSIHNRAINSHCRCVPILSYCRLFSNFTSNCVSCRPELQLAPLQFDGHIDGSAFNIDTWHGFRPEIRVSGVMQEADHIRVKELHECRKRVLSLSHALFSCVCLIMTSTPTHTIHRSCSQLRQLSQPHLRKHLFVVFGILH